MSGQRYGLEIRAALVADAPELARLLGEAAAAMPARLAAMQAGGAVLVAVGWGGLSGLVALGWAPSLVAARPIARVDALVVDADERRRGIGRLLLKAAAQAARSAGCEALELVGAEAFCLANGFTQAGPAFTRTLRRRPG